MTAEEKTTTEAARTLGKLRAAKESTEAHLERSRKGGKRAAKRMTKKQRSERAQKAARARWKKNGKPITFHETE